MGYSLSWLAAEGLPLEALLGSLGLELTGESPHYVDRPLTGCSLPGGWSIIVADRCDHRIIGVAELASLSQVCDVVACSVEEHVMFSCAELWAQGQRVWRVAHDAQQSFDHLSAEGALPSDFEPVRRRHAEQQQAEGGQGAGVDRYFEIPRVLAQTRVGCKHDEGASPEPEHGFVVLRDGKDAPNDHGRKASWQFWR